MKLRAVIDTLTYGIFAKAPVSYAPGGSGFGAHSYGSAPEDAMQSVGTLYSIVNLLATSTARVDWHLYRKSIDGRRVYGPVEDNRREVTTHPALNLLNNPNPLMTRNELIERGQMSIELQGESFWIVVSDRGMPVELWPVRPDRMTEALDAGGHLAGWVYREPDGGKTPFTLEEVIHVQTPSPSNPFRGMSPVQALATDLASVQAAGRFNLNFFRNSARPGGFIRVPSAIGDTEFTRLQTQFREQHQGVANAHRVGILEAGMDWVDASVSMLDMQFAELRNLSRDLIREAYRIHPHMLGQSDDVNRANALAASVDFGAWQLEPRLERWEMAFNGQLLRLFGDVGNGVEFCHDNPVPDDPEAENAERGSKVDAAVKLIGVGFDPEETLSAFGLPPIPWVKPEAAPAPEPPAPPTVEEQLKAILNAKYPSSTRRVKA